MTDVQPWVAATYTGLADLLEATDGVWDQPLCEGVARTQRGRSRDDARTAHPRAVRRDYGSAGGDFTTFSNTVATRDGALPVENLLAQLRSERPTRGSPRAAGPQVP